MKSNGCLLNFTFHILKLEIDTGYWHLFAHHYLLRKNISKTPTFCRFRGTVIIGIYPQKRS